MMAHRYLSLSAVVLLIYGCGGSDGDSTPPLPPALVGTLPTSPNVDSRPLVRGNTEPGALVRLYTEAGCGGLSVGLGIADGGGIFIATVTEPVIGNADTAFQATATDAAGNVSNCSASLTYRSLIPGVSFSEPAGSPFSVGDSPLSLALGDVDGDEALDLVTANQFSDNLSVLLGNGDGTFNQMAGPFATNGTRPSSVATGDLNGDGHLDLAAGNFDSDDISVLLGTGDGSFGSVANIAVGNMPGFVGIADLNGDGALDLVAANQSSDSVSVLLGDGAGGFTPATASPFGVGDNPSSVAIADLDGDALDLVITNQFSDNVSVLLGDGDGGFTSAAESPFGVGDAPLSVAVADLDGDGALDLVAANRLSDNVSVLLGDGDGGFTSAAESPFDSGEDPRSVAIADLNADGRPDIVTANFIDDNVSVLLGDGSGSFETGITLLAGDAPTSVAIGDLNEDGRPDIAVANNFADTVSVLLSQP